MKYGIMYYTGNIKYRFAFILNDSCYPLEAEGHLAQYNLDFINYYKLFKGFN